MTELPFSGQPSHPRRSSNDDILEISQNVNNVAARLRVLEDRYDNIRRKTQLTEQNLLEFERRIAAQAKQMQTVLEGLEKGFSEAMEKVEAMQHELANTVKASDFKVLEKYIDAWEPLQFVTRQEFNQFLDQRPRW